MIPTAYIFRDVFPRDKSVELWTPKGEIRSDTPEARLMQGLLA